MRLGKRSLATILIAVALAAVAGAQPRKRDVKPAAKLADEKPTGSIYSVEPSPAAYLSGEANVAVSGNKNPEIRLGLSPNGATIIEFPASDKLFNIIPGNSNLVTVEESPTKETDRFIIVRPGDGFASPTTMAQARRQPATSVIVQMTSGLVITFLFYPVPQLAEQAHRVMVTYDRNEVIAARRAAGLAVNLDSGIDETRRATTSMRVVSSNTDVGPVSTDAPPPPETPVLKSQPPERPGSKSQPTEEPKLKRVDLGNAVSDALAQALKTTDSFKNWGTQAHGLSISAMPVHDLDGHAQVVVFAVRNRRKTAARLVPGQPEINIETVNDKGKLLTVSTVKKLGERTTVVGEVIPAKAVEYYAVAYEAPILGFRQRLRVAVGTTTAADEPAIAALIW